MFPYLEEEEMSAFRIANEIEDSDVEEDGTTEELRSLPLADMRCALRLRRSRRWLVFLLLLLCCGEELAVIVLRIKGGGGMAALSSAELLGLYAWPDLGVVSPRF